MLSSDGRRREALAKRGESAPHYLWCADELSGGDFSADIRDPSVTALCRRWYAQLSGRQTEEEELLPMRQMVQRVATRLNCLSWKEYVPVTDDFVVFPADASHTFCADYDEMMASVPADRIELLRSRKMLGTRYWYTLSTESEDDL
jgi:hypothetical protein